MWWGLSLDTWNNLIVIFLVSGAFLGVLGGGATYIAFQLQKQEAADATAALERYKAVVSGEIAGADEKIRSARNDAELKIAEAKRDAARANESAEELRHKNLVLHKEVAPRHVYPAQQKVIVEALAAHAKSPGIVWIASLMDEEAAHFAFEIDDTLKDAGVSTGWQTKWIDKELSGYFLLFPSPLEQIGVTVWEPDSKFLREAFRKAGYSFCEYTGPMPSQFKPPIIFVGKKPAPFIGLPLTKATRKVEEEDAALGALSPEKLEGLMKVQPVCPKKF